MRDIKVTYDGKYPCSCGGVLIITVDDEEIYNKQYCCFSTGEAGCDSNYESYCTNGELLWEEADKYDKDIQDAVEDVLCDISVCCGGCI